MRTIATAVESTRVKTMSIDYSVLIAGGVTSGGLPDLAGAVPLCPRGGNYTLSSGQAGTAASYRVSCNIPGHGTFEPSVDSN